MKRPVLLSATFLAVIGFSGCDGQPTTDRPRAEPGVVDEESPSPEPANGGGTTSDLAVTSNIPAAVTAAPDRVIAPVPAMPSAVPAPAVPPVVSSATTPPLETGAVVTTPPPPVPAPSTPITGQDDAITSAAYRVLALQSGLSAAGKVVTISTVDGKVMLRGAVATVEERERIIAAIGRLTGVRAIEDLLDVQEH